MADQRASRHDDPMNIIVPAARMADLITNEMGDQVIVYDKRMHHIHHLNEPAAAIWRTCDGRKSLRELQRELNVANDEMTDAMTIRLALCKLDDAALLERPLSPRLRGQTHTRRGFVRKAAAGGAIALPMIVSMTAPTAAQTMSQPDPVCSQLYEPCVTDTSCCPGLRCEAWVYNPNLGTLPYGCVQV